MLSRRYTIVIADRSSGVVRRVTFRLRWAMVTVAGVLAMPILIGLGARWSATVEIDQLRASNADLEVENASYRAATGELASQIASLQFVVNDLGDRTGLDAGTLAAVRRLPAVVRARAAGGAIPPSATETLLSAATISPESSFGILRDLLGSLETRLQSVRRGVEGSRALAAATPTIWPAHGWLSGGFGYRRDPFTGANDFHTGLDISSSQGQPVYATADGVVESASYSGAYGNLVVVRHEFGLSTRFGHLSRFAVKPGQTVERGAVIGYVGSTGRSTGSHVHYEVWANGRAINPLGLIVTKTRDREPESADTDR